MNILFVHDAFPSQFTHLFKHLLKERKHTLMVACRKGSVAKVPCQQFVYDAFPKAQAEKWRLGTSSDAFELGLSLVKQVAALSGAEHEPDIIVSHASTGASFYLKDIFPRARFVSLFEWYYSQSKISVGAELKLTPFIKAAHKTSMQNIAITREFELADAAYTPTAFQRAQMPAYYQDRIEEIHDGIDTSLYQPDPSATFSVGNKTFTAADEVITYAARGMEKARGFPQFMKAVGIALKARPNAHVIIAAADRICYGNKNDPGLKQWAIDNVDYDPARVHFVGLLPEEQFVKMLQVSCLHVYLTIPFVLSWSLLNAMSVGACVLASDTGPVQEAIADGVNGYLVSFDNVSAIAARMQALLAENKQQSAATDALRQAARQTILDRYELTSCLQKQLELMGVAD